MLLSREISIQGDQNNLSHRLLTTSDAAKTFSWSQDIFSHYFLLFHMIGFCLHLLADSNPQSHFYIHPSKCLLAVSIGLSRAIFSSFVQSGVYSVCTSPVYPKLTRIYTTPWFSINTTSLVGSYKTTKKAQPYPSQFMMSCNFEGDLNQSCFEKQFNKIVLHKKVLHKKV